MAEGISDTFDENQGTAEMKTEKQSREQSTIRFPYSDLMDAETVAVGIMSRGGVPCEPDQLAAALNLAPNGGAFRTKIATAKLFGLIESSVGLYQLSPLGIKIVDPDLRAAAKVKAFLTVPLYRRAYDEFRNRPLPPRPTALEHAFIEFGVAPKQKERARQAFDRSAQQAGFFDHGNRNRLVRPMIAGIFGDNGANATAENIPQAEPEYETENSFDRQAIKTNNIGNDQSELHPFIQGLLKTLPEPETNWAIEGRAKWLQAAANIFDLMYKGDGEIAIRASSSESEII